ncbi:cation transporter, partial [Cronobacter sakazakii]
MAHSHTHSHSHEPHEHSHNNSNSKRLLIAFLITAIFMVLEIAGGLLSGSLALLADAGHMFTDAAALLVALMAVRFARR